MPIPPPPWNWQRLPPPNIIEAYGGRPYNAEVPSALAPAGINPNVANWLQENVPYYRMGTWADIPTTWGTIRPSGVYYGSLQDAPPTVLSWIPSPEVITHESAHAYFDNYGRLWPPASAPSGEPQRLNTYGQLLSKVKQLAVDPAFQGTRLGIYAQMLARQPQVGDEEMFATLATAVGNNWGALPDYLQPFFTGFQGTGNPEGMRDINKGQTRLPAPPPMMPIWTNPSVQGIINERRQR